MLDYQKICINFFQNLRAIYEKQPINQYISQYKVILIIRENTKENAESLSVQNSGLNERAKYLYHNHLYDDLAEKLEIKIKMVNEYMVKLSNLLNVPIDTYENIYYGTGLIDKSISLDYEILHPKHKQRQGA